MAAAYDMSLPNPIIRVVCERNGLHVQLMNFFCENRLVTSSFGVHTSDQSVGKTTWPFMNFITIFFHVRF